MFAKNSMRLFLAAVIFASAAAPASAQEARTILSTFPDSQGVLYFNSQRIFNEALPKIIPPEQLDKMFADGQKSAGFDIRSIHFVALGARFQEPVSPQKPPEFFVMVKGDFNIEGLLSTLRLGAGDAHTRETYKGRTLDVFKTDKLNKKPAPTPGGEAGSAPRPQPTPFPFPEVAATIFDANTLVFGIPAYVKSAIDAAEAEQGRIRADLLELVTRNPDNLVSLVGDVPASTADLLKSLGTPQNEELNRIVASLRQVQFALQMNAADFRLQSIVKTDTADNARGLNGLASMGLSFARMGIEGELNKVPANKPQERETLRAVLDVISSIRNTTTDNEVQIDISVPQAKIASLVAKEMARRKAAETKKPARRAPRRRGSRRR